MLAASKDLDFDPAKRFNRAKALLEARKAKGDPTWAKNDDKVVQRLYKMLKDMRDNVEVKDHEAKRAHLMWLENSRSSPKYIIEAMALTDSTDTEIAECCGMPSGLCGFYIAAFFDVRVNGGRERYIARLNGELTTYSHDQFHDVGYKRVAIMGGSELFRRMILRQAPLTDADLDKLDQEELHVKAMHSWSMTWEGLNPKVTRHEPKRALVDQMNPRTHMRERASVKAATGQSSGDQLTSLLDALAEVARPRIGKKA